MITLKSIAGVIDSIDSTYAYQMLAKNSYFYKLATYGIDLRIFSTRAAGDQAYLTRRRLHTMYKIIRVLGPTGEAGNVEQALRKLGIYEQELEYHDRIVKDYQAVWISRPFNADYKEAFKHSCVQAQLTWLLEQTS